MYKPFTADDFVNNKKVQKNVFTKMEMLDKFIDFPSLGGSQYATTKQVADFYRVSTDEIKAWHKRAKEAFKIAGVKKMSGKEIMSSVKFTGTVIVEKVKGGLIINDIPVVYSSNLLFSHNAIILIGVFSTDSIVAERMRATLLNVESIDEKYHKKSLEAYMEFKKACTVESGMKCYGILSDMKHNITAELTA